MNARIDSIRAQALQALQTSIWKDFEVYQEFAKTQPTPPDLDPLLSQYIKEYCSELTERSCFQLAWQNLLRKVQGLYEKSYQGHDFTSALCYASQLHAWDKTPISAEAVIRIEDILQTIDQATDSVKNRDYRTALKFFNTLIEKVGTGDFPLSVADWTGTVNSLRNRARLIVFKRCLIWLSVLLVLLAGLTTHTIRRLAESNRMKEEITVKVLSQFLSQTGSVRVASAELEELRKQSERTEPVLTKLLQKGLPRAVQNGDRDAAFILARCSEEGFGVRKNITESFSWCHKAAELGHVAAQHTVGNFYANGLGVAKDLVEAAKWFRKAADQGDVEAQYKLGLCYKKGLGINEDLVSAIKWFREAASHGSEKALLELVWCYKNGGGGKDLLEETKWYRKAAELGDMSAQLELAGRYKNGLGVEKDFVEAAKWYRAAAEFGDAAAQVELAWCYKNGQGVDKNSYEAATWYRKAAEQGHAIAQNNLGYCYENGQGVYKDLDEAMQWYRKAAEQGLAEAQNNLGFYYEKWSGIKKDLPEAVRWYRKAAEQGHAAALVNLRRLNAL